MDDQGFLVQFYFIELKQRPETEKIGLFRPRN